MSKKVQNGGSSRRILIVEDVAAIAMDLEEILEEAGYEIAAAAPDVRTAEGIIRQNVSLDAALLDINLDGELVFSVARLLRERNVPFLFLSGYKAERVLPRELEGCPYLEKPVEPSCLLAKLAELFS